MSDAPDFAPLLGEHRFVNGGGVSGLIFPVACACGLPTPGWAAWDAHVASVLEAHTADRERRIPSSDELTCGDCSEPYAVWFTDNDVWNLVVGGPHAKDDPGGMLCPRCFTIRAEAVYALPIWHLFLDRVNRVERESDRERAAAEKALRDACAEYGRTFENAPTQDAVHLLSWLRDRADTYRRTDKEADRG